MKQTLIDKIKIWWWALFVPKNTPYCHHRFKLSKKYGYCAKPCRYWCRKYDPEYMYDREYCKILKDFLSVDDQIKDCGINDYFDFEE